VTEHVEKGVGLAFDPEVVADFDVVSDLEGGRFAGVGDDVGVVGAGDGADAFFVGAGEEIVPGCETVVFRLGVTVVHIHELVGGHADVGGSGQVFDAGGAEPACRALVEDFG